MRKIFLAVAAMAMLATACTKDDSAVVGNESLVSFTIDSPELATRYGEGTTATNLEWAFYDENGEKLDAISSSISNFGGSYSLTVELVDGRNYTALFWASAPDAPYTVNWDDKKMVVGSTLTANNEGYDAFYKHLSINNTQKTYKVELTRPFAQINIATKDLEKAEAAGVNVKSTKVSVAGYNTLNFEDGSVEGETTFTYNWAPKAVGKAMTDYDMLSMNYVLVEQKELVNVTLQVSEEEVSETATYADALTRTYTTVPVQRNYRTYIVGNLLTTTNEFNVTTVPGFNPNPEIYEVWDGESTTAVTPDANGVYQINTVKEFAWLGSFLAGKGLTDAKISINNSFDMGGYEFGNLMLSGTSSIEGNGNTIMNVAFVEAPETRSGHNGQAAGAAFVYVPSKAKVSISNLSFDNASAQGILHGHGSGGAAIVSTYVQGELTLNKVNVKNSKVNGIYALGALVGDLPGNGVLTATNCSVESVVIENTEVEGESGLLGSAVGRIAGKATIDGISVKDVDINAYVGEATTKRSVGGLVGNLRGGELVLTNVAKFEDVVITPKNAIAADYIDMIDEYVGGYYDNYNYTLNGENVYYKTASQKAFEAAIAQGGEVKLTEDVEIVVPVVIAEGADVTIDLNGKTISGKLATGVGAVLSNEGKLTIKGGTIENTTTNGDAAINNTGELVLDGATVVGAPLADGGYSAYAVISSGKLTINEGTAVSADRGCLKFSGAGETIINGGTFSNNDIGSRNLTSHVVDVEDGGSHKLTINGGTFQHNHAATSGGVVICNRTKGTVYVNGGNFSGGNYYGNNNLSDYGYGGTFVVTGGTYTAKPAAKYIAEGYKAVETNGKYMVVADTVSEDAIVSDAAGLASAIVNGGEAILTGDVAYSSAINNDANINLNGNTFEATTTLELKNNADLTMVGGNYEVNGTNGHVDVRPSTAEGSVVVFEDVDFSFNKLNKTYGPSTNRLGSVVEVCATVTDANTKILFKNCTFDNAQVLFEGLSGTIGTFEAEFDGCTFNALTSSAPIYVQNYVKGTIKMTGCTFNLTCTSSTASAVSVSPSSSTSVTITATNNTINAVAATPYTFDASKGETEEHNVKVNGTPADIKFISYYANTTVNETGTTKTGIAQ